MINLEEPEMMKREREKGPALTKAVVLIVVAALVIFVGWYVLSPEKPDTKTSKHSTTQKHTEKQSPDLTSNWKSYTSSEGKYSLKYPSDWVIASHLERCGSNTLLLGSTKDTVGVCASESAGQISFSSFSVESGPMGITDEYYSDVTNEAVTADGVQGEKQSGLYSHEGETLGLPQGTKRVVYIFKTNGLIYKADYIQFPNYPNVEKEFDTIVTNTLRFN